jgi:hypothetical protein
LSAEYDRLVSENSQLRMGKPGRFRGSHRSSMGGKCGQTGEKVGWKRRRDIWKWRNSAATYLKIVVFWHFL